MDQTLILFRNRALFRVTIVVAALVVAAAAYQAAGRDRDPRILVFLAVLEGTIIAAMLANRVRPHPVLPVVMAGAGLAGAAVSNGPIAGFGVFVALMSAGGRFPPAYGATFAVLVVLLLEVIGNRARSQPLVSTAFELLGFGAVYVGALGLRQIRDEQARTKAALAELEQSRELQVRAARVAERIRLAREIHDVLGHTLSALAVQLESARLLMLQRPDDPAALAAVERAHRLTREGMEEARRAVGTLRGDRLPGPSLLANLVSDYERDSGTTARLLVEGEPVGLSPEARLAVYRTAQEALTNVGKHAAAGQVDVRLRYDREGAELTVENDGGSRPAAPSDGGYGLTGIRERAELLGGRLEAAPTRDGFKVRLWVPAEAAEA
jgi:signal transduction histidine kinase